MSDSVVEKEVRGGSRAYLFEMSPEVASDIVEQSKRGFRINDREEVVYDCSNVIQPVVRSDMSIGEVPFEGKETHFSPDL